VSPLLAGAVVLRSFQEPAKRCVFQRFSSR